VNKQDYKASEQEEEEAITLGGVSHFNDKAVIIHSWGWQRWNSHFIKCSRFNFQDPPSSGLMLSTSTNPSWGKGFRGSSSGWVTTNNGR